MSFSDELEQFRSSHPYSETEIDGIRVSYLLCGNENSRTELVYLVGGTGFSTAWFNHIKQMEQEYRVLTFDYPYGVENLEELADLVIKLTDKLQIKDPVFIGASLGGILAQVIARKYSDKMTGVCLYSTTCLSEKSIAGLKKHYKSYGLLMKLMKIVPYSWIRKMLISVSKKQVGLTNEPEQDKKYMEDFFAWVYRNYTKEFDIHMTTLMTDTAKLKPMTREDYARYDKKTLLVLPLNDEAFPQEAQQELMEMLPDAHTVRVTGGHTSTLYKVGEYVAVTKEFIANTAE